ncbi:MAG: AAA family ATPase [bacterium]|nr:AAA family ATPase [bacterium]
MPLNRRPPVAKPPSPEQVLELLERGEISPTEAFALWRRLDRPEALEPAPSPAPRVEEIMRELDALVGLGQVKRLVREIQAFVSIQARRAREGLVSEPMVLHMIFRGNPGTGKTTVARLLGKILRESGVLEKGHVVEVERADLVGEYIGHTAQKTREQLRRALGGILFIDEAYSLARGGDKDFGREAIDTLVKAMEDQKRDLILILAGYQREMSGFLHANPGLRSRFPLHLDFPDYTVEELLAIADLMLRQRQYRLDAEARRQLARRVEEERANPFTADNSGNARLVRNLIERGMRRQASRLVEEGDLTRDQLMTIVPADLEGDD